MAGAGQPWYMPLTWPIGHVVSAVNRPEKEEANKPVAMGDLDLVGHGTAMVGAFRAIVFASVCMFGGKQPYPAFGSASTYDTSWMLPILFRNLAAAWIICGSWDWFLYFSPLKKKLEKFKLNPKYPPWNQIKHDCFWTTTAMFTAAACEIQFCHWYATDNVSRDSTFAGFLSEVRAYPLFYIFWGLLLTHWRVIHFYVIHRLMHPWKTENPNLDFGKFLYKHVHSLHHQSYNPTSFSGTSMHPVESYAYFSCAFIAVLFNCHPAIPLACVIDCAVGAWLGHDGFQWPGSGDFFHQLHHKHFDCNYGAMHVPIDLWLGTFASNGKDVKEIWRDVNARKRKMKAEKQK